MDTHFVFVDLENVQPDAASWSRAAAPGVKIFVFVNSKQKMPIDRVKVLQPLGDQVEYVEMSGSGNNALDFFIAFYLGQIAHDNPKAGLYVVSNDTGFDPLIKYLADMRKPAPVKRVGDLKKVKFPPATETAVAAAQASGGCLSVPPVPAAPATAVPQVLVDCSSTPPEPAQLVAPPDCLKQRVIRICAALCEDSENKRLISMSDLRIFIKSVLGVDDLPDQHLTGLLKFMVHKQLILTGVDEKVIFNEENIKAGSSGIFYSKADGLINTIRSNFEKRGTSKPRTLKTLSSTINTVLKNTLGEVPESQIEKLIDLMKTRNIITVDGTKVSYNLLASS